jgi:hypothetical protein
MSGVGQVLKMGAKGVDALIDVLRTGKKLAPQEEALMLAQQRAALPIEKGGLGLSPTNTAAERATAMGFDKNVYRGTKANEVTHKGNVYVTDMPESANYYAGHVVQDELYPMLTRHEGGNVMPLRGHADFVKQNNAAPLSTGGNRYEIKNEALRSRFAAFDPWRKTAATAATMGVAAPDLLAQEAPPMSREDIEFMHGLLGTKMLAQELRKK